MNSLWQTISNLFRPLPEAALPQDSSVYCVETSSGKYCGRILYQDDVVIRLRCSKHKPVKILKTNIERISLVKNETVQQYQQWLNTKSVRYSV